MAHYGRRTYRRVDDDELAECKARVIALRGADFESGLSGKVKDKMRATGELHDLTGQSEKARAYRFEQYQAAIQTAEREDQARAKNEQNHLSAKAALERAEEIKKTTLAQGNRILASIGSNRAAAIARQRISKDAEARCRQMMGEGTPETMQVGALENFVNAKLGPGSFRPMLQKHCTALGIEGEPSLAQIKSAISMEFVDGLPLPKF